MYASPLRAHMTLACVFFADYASVAPYSASCVMLVPIPRSSNVQAWLMLILALETRLSQQTGPQVRRRLPKQEVVDMARCALSKRLEGGLGVESCAHIPPAAVARAGHFEAHICPFLYCVPYVQ